MNAAPGQNTKNPLSGSGTYTVVERFSEMQDDLASERKATIKRWAKREQQLPAVLDSTAGHYGDLQGIAGRSMIEIAAFETPLLEADEQPA